MVVPHLGHTKLESTARYLDWLPEEIKEEYEFLFEKKDPPVITA